MVEIDCVWIFEYFEYLASKKQEKPIPEMVNQMVSSYYSYVDNNIKDYTEIEFTKMGISMEEELEV